MWQRDPTVLWTTNIDEEIESRPQEKLLSVKTFILHDFIRDLDRFVRFLERCPNATTISTRGLLRPIPAGFRVPSNVVPKLEKFEWVLPVVPLFLPGRKVEAVCINGDEQVHTSDWSTEKLRSFAPYSSAVRALELKPLLWHDGCLEVIAETFPKLESLKLKIAKMPDHVRPL